MCRSLNYLLLFCLILILFFQSLWHIKLARSSYNYHFKYKFILLKFIVRFLEEKIFSFWNTCFLKCVDKALSKGRVKHWLSYSMGRNDANQEARILHQIYKFSGGINIWGRIHQSKRWYYWGRPGQTPKVDFFCWNCFRIGAVKRFQIRRFTGSIRRFVETVFIFL